MGKNIVVRLHVYLMCFLLAFSPAYSYASAAPKLDFAAITNFVRDQAGAIADYRFKRSANDPLYNAANDDRFETKAHRVSNGALAKVGHARMLNPWMLVAGVAFPFVVSELISAMEDEGWTVDTANQEIYKLDGGLRFYIDTNGFNKQYFPSAEAAIQNFLDAKKQPDQPAPTFTGYNTDFPKPLSDMRAGETIFRTFGTSIGPYILSVDKNSESKQVATESDVAAVLPNVSDAQILELMKSPDFAAEPHAPTVAAAAKAEPAGSDACPAGQTKVNGVCQAPPSENKCPAGQTFDTTTGKCKAATAAQCPVGQVYDVVQKKCVTPKLPDDEDDWPEFCEWAAPVCDFIEWAKQDTDKFDVSPVDVKDTAADAQSITSQILTLGYVSGGIKACPADYTFTFTVMGQAIDFDLSYKGLCDMLLMARPVVISIAYFQAAKIVFIGRRD